MPAYIHYATLCYTTLSHSSSMAIRLECFVLYPILTYPTLLYPALSSFFLSKTSFSTDTHSYLHVFTFCTTFT
ncbi:hypothetical protein BDW71DRAFT_75770 [Aspergillus fruticulosus]